MPVAYGHSSSQGGPSWLLAKPLRKGGDAHLLALGALQTSDAICPLRKQRRKVSSRKPEPLRTPQKRA